MKNHFKCYLAVFLLFAATLSANAQYDYYYETNRMQTNRTMYENNRETSRFHMGIRGGLSINSFRGDESKKMNPLYYFTGGLAFDWQLGSKPVFIGFGLNYLNEGFREVYDGTDYTKYLTGNFHHLKSRDIPAIHIPLVFGYHFNVAPNLFISPYGGGFASYSVEELEDYDQWEEYRFNCGVRFGCCLNFGRLTFDLAYDLGLRDVNNDSHYTSYTGTFFATIGFNIVGSR